MNKVIQGLQKVKVYKVEYWDSRGVIDRSNTRIIISHKVKLTLQQMCKWLSPDIDMDTYWESGDYDRESVIVPSSNNQLHVVYRKQHNYRTTIL